MDLSDVRVHSNSEQPSRLGALAFAQGNDIHLGPGQEHHLPHEAWHVIQQRRGQVRPTKQMAGRSLNDDETLETEADAMGERARQLGQFNPPRESLDATPVSPVSPVATDPGASSPAQLMTAKTAAMFERSFVTPSWDEFYAAQQEAQRLLVGSGEEKTVTRPASAEHEKAQVTPRGEKEEKKEKEKVAETPTAPVESGRQNTENQEKRSRGRIEDENEFSAMTFGIEHEWFPYDPKHKFANTAHIVLATSAGLPYVAGVPDKLVTDSDNVIEYSSAVFVFPLEPAKPDFAGAGIKYIKMARDRLERKRHSIKNRVNTFKALLAELTFTRWQVHADPEVGWANIDEATNVDRLRKEKADPLDIQIFVNKHSSDKHKEFQGNANLYKSMQSTLLVPLPVALRMMSALAPEIIETGKPAKGQSQNLSKEEKRNQPAAREPHRLEELRNAIWQALTERLSHKTAPEGKEYLAALTQRMSLLLGHSKAVKFQAEFQQRSFLGKEHIPTLTEEENKQYGLQDEEYLRRKEPKSPYDSSKTNFHRDHSALKDDLLVWVRVYLEDILTFVKNAVTFQSGGPFEALLPIIYDIGLQEKFAYFLAHSETEPYPKRESVDFLEDNPFLPDLRQDTLRNVQTINGVPFVQIEIRNLEDNTLRKVSDALEHASKPYG